MGASGLGALLVREGLLSEQDRRTIGKTCGQSSWAFAKCVLAMGMLDEDELAAFFAERTKYHVAPRNLLNHLDTQILERIDARMVARLEVLPIRCEEDKIRVAVADPLDKSTLRQIEFFTGMEVQPVIAPLSQIYAGLKRLIPDFHPQYTALSSFLHNHAASAWQRQRIDEEIEFDETGMTSSRREHGLIADDDHGDDELAEESLHDLYEENLEEEEDLAGDLLEEDSALPIQEDAEDFGDVEVDHAEDLELSQSDDGLEEEEDIGNFDLSALDDDPPPPGSKQQIASKPKPSPIDELDFEDEQSELNIASNGDQQDQAADEMSMGDADLLAEETEESDDDFFGAPSGSKTPKTEEKPDEDHESLELSGDELPVNSDQDLTEDDLLPSPEEEVDGDMEATDHTDQDDEALFSGDALSDELSDDLSEAEDDDILSDDEMTAESNEDDSLLDMRPGSSSVDNNIFQELAHQTTQGMPILDESDDDLLNEIPESSDEVIKPPRQREDELIMKTQPQKRLDESHDDFNDDDFDLDDEVDDEAQTAFEPLTTNQSLDEEDEELRAETQFGHTAQSLQDDIDLDSGDHDVAIDAPMVSASADLMMTNEPDPSVTMERELSFNDEPEIDLPKFTDPPVSAPQFSAVAVINQTLLRLSLTSQKERIISMVEEALKAAAKDGFIVSFKEKKVEVIAAWCQEESNPADFMTTISKKYLGSQLKKSEPGTWRDCNFSDVLAKQFGKRKQAYRLYHSRHTAAAHLFFICQLPDGNRMSLQEAIGPLLDQFSKKWFSI